VKEVELFVPGRLSLIGGISDIVAPYLSKNKKLIPGHAIAVTLDMGIYAKVSKAQELIYIANNKYFKCKTDEQILNKEAQANNFYSYICGTILYLKQNYKSISGIKIEITKMDLPIKKGLSSSAAICIIIAKAYNELYHLNLTDEEIKKVAYEGEHLANSKCGMLDQTSILSNDIMHITFYNNNTKTEKVKVKKNINILIVDLNGKKKKKKILKVFNEALPFIKNNNDKLIHNVIGKRNKRLVEKSVKAIENGNIKKLGKYFLESQKNIDKVAVICEELVAPLLHKILKDRYIKKYSYGGKGTGSGGDGSLILISKNEEANDKMYKYIRQKYKMKVFKLTIQKSI